jgi:predicted nucleic acid-binding protein
MLRIALDANVILSGLFFEGNEEELLLGGLSGRYRLVLSRELMVEVADVVARKFSGSPKAQSAMSILEDVALASEFHHGPYPGKVIVEAAALSRDPDDAVHVAFLMVSKPDAFATGDGDMLALKNVGRTKVLRTRAALSLMD